MKEIISDIYYWALTKFYQLITTKVEWKQFSKEEKEKFL